MKITIEESLKKPRKRVFYLENKETIIFDKTIEINCVIFKRFWAEFAVAP